VKSGSYIYHFRTTFGKQIEVSRFVTCEVYFSHLLELSRLQSKVGKEETV